MEGFRGATRIAPQGIFHRFLFFQGFDFFGQVEFVGFEFRIRYDLRYSRFEDLGANGHNAGERILDSIRVSIIFDGVGRIEVSLIGRKSLPGAPQQAGRCFEVVEDRFPIRLGGFDHIAVDTIEFLDSRAFHRFEEFRVLLNREGNCAKLELLRHRSLQQLGSRDR